MIQIHIPQHGSIHQMIITTNHLVLHCRILPHQPHVIIHFRSPTQTAQPIQPH